jgi:hypothetical protein
MKSSRRIRQASAVALATLLAGCATWGEMERSEKGTAVGATGGAVVGAAVGGPVGALVGAGVGGYAGHHQGFGKPARAGPNDSPRTGAASDIAMNDSALVRDVQRSLNDRGYDAGPVDGMWGQSTESALREFQQANGFAQTGDLDPRTLSALGVQR